ncbi:MAG: helix-turn-helix domain-containing protein [Erysipelotrichales bacterium]|nr:helix-turn-helix domain-containing protein [Erysipelotrichales bacterium]
MKINEIIQNRRRILNMTQKQLAEKLNVSDKTVSRWELGTVYPNIDMLPKIALVLEVSINELFALPDGAEKPKDSLNYKQIASFQLSFVMLVFFYCCASLLFIFSHGELETLVRTILVIASLTIFSLATFAFLAKRISFRNYYQNKELISDYKYHDGILTGSAFFLITFIVSGSLILASNSRSTNLLLTGITLVMMTIANFYLLKSLGYTLDRASKSFKLVVVATVLLTILLILRFQNAFIYVNIVTFVLLCILYISIFLTYKASLKNGILDENRNK